MGFRWSKLVKAKGLLGFCLLVGWVDFVGLLG